MERKRGSGMIAQGLKLNKIYNMDCVEGLKMLPDNYIDCVVTSPPYNLGGDFHICNNGKKNYLWRLSNFQR